MSVKKSFYFKAFMLKFLKISSGVLILCTGILFTLYYSYTAKKDYSLKEKTNKATKIVSQKKNQHLHGSSITLLPNGTPYVVWFEGSGERTANDVKIKSAMFKNGKWQKTGIIADTLGYPDINPVIYTAHNNTIWIFYYTVTAKRWQSAILKYKKGRMIKDKIIWSDSVIIPVNFSKKDFSTSFEDVLEKKLSQYGTFIGNSLDNKTIQAKFNNTRDLDIHVDTFLEKSTISWLVNTLWGKYSLYAMDLIHNNHQKNRRWFYPEFDTVITPEMGWQTRSKPLESNGRLLLPLYSDNFNMSMMLYTDDKGQNWKVSEPIIGGGNIQPTIIKDTDSNTLVTFMRDNGLPPKRIQKSISKDNGITWSMPTDIPLKNPGSAIDSVVLPSKNWAIIYNPHNYNRSTLAITVSKDKGESWSKPYIIEQKNHAKFHYPAMISTEKSGVWVSYSSPNEDKGRIKSLNLKTIPNENNLLK